MKSTINILLFFLLLFLPFCKDEPVTPKPETKLLLSVEDVSCTEAWVKLTTTNLQLPTSLNLLKDDSIIKTINLQTADTLLYIDSLLPNQTYNFQSVIQSINHSSNEVIVATMDTTSHNFTWQTFEFGQNIGSVLFDVAIIDENNIWAVGAIYMNDSLGNPDPNAYNAVHWDGNEWNLYKFQFYTFCGLSHTGSYPGKSIFVLNNNEIWISSGSQITQINGINQIKTECIPVSVNKLWGTDKNNLYAVGFNGEIVHFNGWRWSRIESGTDVNLQDIYGTPDGKELWTCGWSDGRVSLLRILENSTESIWDSQTNREFSYYYSGQLLNTLWANGNGEFIFATGVVTRHSLFDKKLLRFDWVPIPNGQQRLHLGNYAYRIRGSKKNNIALAGDEAMIWHFNGSTWYNFEAIHNFDDRLYGLAVNDNLIVAVGRSYGNGAGGGLIKIGRRTN